MDMAFEEFASFAGDSAARSAAAPMADPASPLVRLQYLIDNTPAIIYCTSCRKSVAWLRS